MNQENKFKVGDMVRRISDKYCGMCVGNEATITKCDEDGRHVYLDKYNSWHSVAKLELVTPEETDITNYEIY